MSFCVVSCNKTDSEDFDGGSGEEFVGQLQGTWQFLKGSESFMGETFDIDRSMINSMKNLLERQMGTRLKVWDETLSFNGYKLNGVDYKLKGREIILDGMEDLEDLEMKITIKSISSSKLILHEVFKGDDFEIVADMEYIK